MDDATVLCAGHIRRMGVALTGRRSMLGSLHGPMNHESLNGSHPAMLAVQTCNSDVQLPYRFPICSETHSLACEEECVEGADDIVIVRAAQVAQDAQAGYACDYCNKRQPMAFNEIKECCKGLQDLSSRVGGERINYVGKRHASRLMSDAYGKGIVRGQVENTNLRVNGKDNAVTHAETFRTSQTESFFGREYMNMVELLNDRQSPQGKTTFSEVDFRNPRRRKITIRDVATLYGQRPRHPDVWYLSPYEFVTHWETKLLSYPQSLDGATDRRHHVRMTERGMDKLREKARDKAKAKDVELEPGVDYVVLDGGDDWLPYPDVPSTQTFRHTWIMVRRKRPKAPSFAGAPVPRHSHGQHQRAATIVMAYFHPWTLREADDDEHVRYAGRLRPTQDTWQDALATWLDGNILCREAKRYVSNFLCVHRVRPDNDDAEVGNSDDVISDEELQISSDKLAEALATRIGGRERRADADTEEPGDGHYQNSLTAITLAQDVWKSDAPSDEAAMPQFSVPKAIKEILDGAAASQRQGRGMAAMLKNAHRNAAVHQQTAATVADVEKWLRDLKCQTDLKGRPVANAKQFAAVTMVAQRVMQELRAYGDPHIPVGEPLRWCIHGGPGTGKSHVVKLVKKLFIEVLQWDVGVEFQVVAFQAVMADLLGGDTIHHACGIPVKRRDGQNEDAVQTHMAIAKRVLQWRWLIIDEISMVSARLFAEVDLKLRDVIRRIGTEKVDALGVDRPFGGLNVLCSGDFWQLPPPDGGFLADIPTDYIHHGRRYHPAPTVRHGQALFWSGPAGGIQGVSELDECERCSDAWLREVQEEIRHGNLSINNHNFLHGRPTRVPGSWVQGDVACGNKRCRALATGLSEGDLIGPPPKRKAGPIESPLVQPLREAEAPAEQR